MKDKRAFKLRQRDDQAAFDSVAAGNIVQCREQEALQSYNAQPVIATNCAAPAT